jgi:hypothetical protein
LNPSNLGQKVTFTATVTVQAPGGGTVAGKVEFFDGATPLGTGTLSAGQAKFTTAALGLGPHAITAQYGGNADYVKSTSQPVPQSVQGQQLTVTPASLAFGSVAVGGHAKKVVTVTNPNPTAVSVGPVSLTVTQGDAWQFVLEHSCPSKLPAGQSCSIAVVFTPDAIGPDSATINIVNSAPPVRKISGLMDSLQKSGLEQKCALLIDSGFLDQQSIYGQIQTKHPLTRSKWRPLIITDLPKLPTSRLVAGIAVMSLPGPRFRAIACALPTALAAQPKRFRDRSIRKLAT